LRRNNDDDDSLQLQSFIFCYYISTISSLTATPPQPTATITEALGQLLWTSQGGAHPSSNYNEVVQDSIL